MRLEAAAKDEGKIKIGFRNQGVKIPISVRRQSVTPLEVIRDADGCKGTDRTSELEKFNYSGSQSSSELAKKQSVLVQQSANRTSR